MHFFKEKCIKKRDSGCQKFFRVKILLLFRLFAYLSGSIVVNCNILVLKKWFVMCYINMKPMKIVENHLTIFTTTRDRRVPSKNDAKTNKNEDLRIQIIFWFCDFGVFVFSDDACAQLVERASPGLGRVIRKNKNAKITKPKNDLKQNIILFNYYFLYGTLLWSNTILLWSNTILLINC